MSNIKMEVIAEEVNVGVESQKEVEVALSHNQGPVGPRGPKGDPGGPPGPQGENGRDATINGYNAIRIEEGNNINIRQTEGTLVISATTTGTGTGTGAVSSVNGQVGEVVLDADDIEFADGETFQTKFNRGTLKGQDGNDGQQGEKGKDAKINGHNSITIEEGDGIRINQRGSTLTISSTVSGGTSGGTGAVSSVNGKKGVVVLKAKDIDFEDGENFQYKFENGTLKGEDGAKGKDATINGENVISIQPGKNISIDQGDGVLTISSTVSGGTSSGGNDKPILVNISDYGIVSGEFKHKPPYSSSEYRTAYNNKKGFERLMADAKTHHWGIVRLPKGYYPVCYECQESGNPHFSYGFKYAIKIPSDTILDLNGSTIKVIYDSVNRNPNDKRSGGGAEPATLIGTVFAFDKSYNSEIRNGELIGDRYDRAYSSATIEIDKVQEQSYGVVFDNGSTNTVVNNMSIHGFMGDAITATTNANADLGTITPFSKPAFSQGYINNRGEIKNDIPGTYTTDFITLDLKTNEIMVRTNIGYSRVPDFANEEFEVLFFDSMRKYIGRTTARHLDTIILMGETKFIKITIKGEEIGRPSLTKTYQLSTVIPTDAIVKNCNIYDNNRGGLSNLPVTTQVLGCNIHDNGTANHKGWVEFPDTTRYAINCEDSVVKKVTVRDCVIYNHFNGVLLSSYHTIMENNELKNMSTGLGLYVSQKAIMKNNFIYSTPVVLSLEEDRRYDVLVADNDISNCEKVVSSSNSGNLSKSLIRVNDNIIKGVSKYNTDSNIYYSNNTIETVKTLGGAASTLYAAGKNKNNIYNVLYEQNSTNPLKVENAPGSFGNIINAPKITHCYPKRVYGVNLRVKTMWGDVSEGNIMENSVVSSETMLYQYFASTKSGTENIFKNTIFDNFGYIDLTLVGGAISDPNFTTKFVFEDCVFNFTDSKAIGMDIPLSGNQTLNIVFKNCKFNTNGRMQFFVYATQELTNKNFKVDTIDCEFNGVNDNTTPYKTSLSKNKASIVEISEEAYGSLLSRDKNVLYVITE